MSKKTRVAFQDRGAVGRASGTAECHADEVNHFLRHVHCERLILNGDIIDGWSLMRKGGWQNRHTRFVRLVLKHMEKRDTEVIYLRGNHDDVLARVLPIRMHKLYIGEDYVLDAAAGRYLVVHGDVFDVVTRRHRYLAVVGAVGYQGLLQVNRLYNRYPRVARAGVLLAEPGDQGAGQGRRELHRQLREPAPGPGAGPRLRRGHLRAHPHPRRQADGRRPLPEFRRLGRVAHRARRASRRPVRGAAPCRVQAAAAGGDRGGGGPPVRTWCWFPPDPPGRGPPRRPRVRRPRGACTTGPAALLSAAPGPRTASGRAQPARKPVES